MIEADIPGRRIFRFEHLLLDMNGTITLDGAVIEGVRERLLALGEKLDVSVITADTFGTAGKLESELGVKIRKLTPGGEQAQKLELVRELGSEKTVAIGNGANDAAMLGEAAIGICVLGQEGAAAGAINNCNVLAPDINAALDLLLNPVRLIATLRE